MTSRSIRKLQCFVINETKRQLFHPLVRKLRGRMLSVVQHVIFLTKLLRQWQPIMNSFVFR